MGERYVGVREGGGRLCPFKDHIAPAPSPKESDDTSFGSPIEGAPPPTGGLDFKEVQFTNIGGAAPGKVDFIRIPGSDKAGRE